MHDVISAGATAAAEPLWTDVAGFWVSLVAAVATFAAVIVSLWLAFRTGKRERVAVARANAGVLFEILVAAQDALDDITPFDPIFNPLSDASYDAAKEAVTRVDRARQAVVPLMPGEIESRWASLSLLLRELAGEPVRPGGSSWSGPQVDRARRDVDAYIDYVSTSIAAAAAGRKLPPKVEPPVLQRNDTKVWMPR